MPERQHNSALQDKSLIDWWEMVSSTAFHHVLIGRKIDEVKMEILKLGNKMLTFLLLIFCSENFSLIVLMQPLFSYCKKKKKLGSRAVKKEKGRQKEVVLG